MYHELTDFKISTANAFKLRMRRWAFRDSTHKRVVRAFRKHDRSRSSPGLSAHSAVPASVRWMAGQILCGEVHRRRLLCIQWCSQADSRGSVPLPQTHLPLHSHPLSSSHSQSLPLLSLWQASIHSMWYAHWLADIQNTIPARYPAVSQVDLVFVLASQSPYCCCFQSRKCRISPFLPRALNFILYSSWEDLLVCSYVWLICTYEDISHHVLTTTVSVSGWALHWYFTCVTTIKILKSSKDEVHTL